MRQKNQYALSVVTLLHDKLPARKLIPQAKEFPGRKMSSLQASGFSLWCGLEVFLNEKVLSIGQSD